MSLRIPPHDEQAEQAVISAMFVSSDAVCQVFDTLKPDDFYVKTHRIICEAIYALYVSESPIDMVTVGEYLRRTNKLNDIGGLETIGRFTDDIPTAAQHINQYIKIIREKSTLRKLINVSTKVITKAFDERQSVDELCADIDTELMHIQGISTKGELTPLADLLVPAMRRIEAAMQSKNLITGISSGFIDLDLLTNGFQRGELIVIAGRPSMGKSSLASNIMQHTAQKGFKCAFFSLEMTKEMVVDRMVAAESSINHLYIRKGYGLKQEELQCINNGMERIAHYTKDKLWISDDPTLTFAQIKSRAMQWHRRYLLDMVVVDYLQLIYTDDRKFAGNRLAEITFLSGAFKKLARQLNVPLLLLSQLSRRPEQREDKRPQLSDLRESGAIEQDADMVLLIHRPGFYKQEEGEESETQIIIAKQRNGPTGAVNFVFRKPYMRFENRVLSSIAEEA